MTNRILWKFFGAFAFITFTVVIVLLFVISFRLRKQVDAALTQRLFSNAILVERLVADDWQTGQWGRLQEQTTQLAKQLDLRMTLVDKAGVVLVDSDKDPTLMANHINRPEVIQALEQGQGEAIHPSDTLGINMKYVAIRVEGGTQFLGVVRLAIPLTDIQLELEPMYRITLMGALVAMIIAFVLAYFLSNSITEPIVSMRETAGLIAQGQFDTRIQIHGGGELGALAESLNQMADSLKTQLNDLRRMDQVRADFVANVSHELKTPLTLIKGYIETLQTKQVDPERAERFMAIISEHADRLGHIVDDLLSLSEMDSSKKLVHHDPCDLHALLSDVIAGFGHAIQKRDHQLQMATLGENFTLEADHNRLEQVFVNLLDNAIKYTPDGGVIDVQLSEQDSELKVVIRDNGIGIEKIHQDRIFERFYRVDKARSRKLGGTGLGLGIAKHIIEAHGGKIHLESQFGSGTTVTIRLPKV